MTVFFSTKSSDLLNHLNMSYFLLSAISFPFFYAPTLKANSVTQWTGLQKWKALLPVGL